jgi:hydrogenase maturation protease
LKILLYGYGNPGRQDDGLGVAFVSRIEEWVKGSGLGGFEFENNYQLNIEDAEAIAEKDLVVFADASEEGIEDFCISKVDESAKVAFTTHAASPGYIVKLCKDLFNKEPLVLLLHLKGYEWEFQEGFSEGAEKNLEDALEYMKAVLLKPEEIIAGYKNLKNC